MIFFAYKNLKGLKTKAGRKPILPAFAIKNVMPNIFMV